MNLVSPLDQKLGRIQRAEPLSAHTTLGIGGPADYFFEAKSKVQLIQAIKVAQKLKIPWLVIGGGSNIIVRDKGIEGLVIKNLLQDFAAKPFFKEFTPQPVTPRLAQLDTQAYLAVPETPSFKNSDLKFKVKVGSGWKMNPLIERSFQEGLVGLEWFAGIPGSIGGGVFMNIHGGYHFLSDFVYQVTSFDPEQGKEVTLNQSQLEFDYDFSIFHENSQVILAVDLILHQGNFEQAKRIQQHWLRQKLRVQPQRSCGSVWQNLEPRVQKKLKLPTPGIGYLIDKRLGLKGKRIGQARISLKHAGFIENLGGAQAQDVLKLIELVESKVQAKFRIKLQREVEIIGRK